MSARAEELERDGARDPASPIGMANRFLEADAYMVMIESEGITENVKTWRTNVPARIIKALGLEKVIFEEPIPRSSLGTSRTMGRSLFLDHSQIVQLDCLRRGI